MMWLTRRLRRWLRGPDAKPPRPWSLPPEEARARFDAIRNAIPVGDDEMSRARDITPRRPAPAMTERLLP